MKKYRIKSIGFLFLIILTGCFYILPERNTVFAAPVTIYASADSYVESSGNGAIYANDPTVYVGCEPIGWGLDWERGIVNFDLSSIGGAVSSATLRIYINEITGTPSPKLNLYGASEDVDAESTNTEPTKDYTIQENSSPFMGWNDFDVTNFINAEIAHDSMATFILTYLENQSSDLYFTFASDEDSTNKAQIVYTDSISPTVSSINRQSPAQATTNSTSVTYRVTFSEGVNGVDTSDFALTASGASGTISSISGSGKTYDVTVNSVSGNGTLRLDLNSSGTGITDLLGNAISGGYTSGQTYTIDNIVPSVSSINRQSPVDATTNATSVTYQVTFSESVSGVDTSDFTLTASGASGTINSISGGGTTYNVTVNSVSGDGTLRLDLKNSGTGIVDAVSNEISGGFTSGQTYTIDTTAPSVSSIIRQSPIQEITNATSVTYRVTFSESVSGVDTSDFTLTASGASGIIDSISGSGTTYDVTVNSIGGSGTLRLDLKSSGTGIIDAASNPVSGGFTSGQSYTIENNAPFVSSITRQSPAQATTNATSVTYRVTFSESVSGVDISDFTLTVSGVLGMIDSISGSDTTYIVTVNSVSGDGTLRLDLKSSGTGITDTTSNLIIGGFTSGESYTIDNTAPSLSSINRQNPSQVTTSATSVTYRITFSESISGVDISDFTLTASGVSGTIASISGSGTTYDVTVNSVSGNGTLRLDLKSSGTGIADTAGNAVSGGFVSGQTYTIDTTTPSVNSINRQSPAQETTNAASVTYRVTFSENVSGVDTSDFTLTAVGASGTITSISGSGTMYDVTVTSVSGNGTLRLDLKGSGTEITDTIGTVISGGFTGGQIYIIDTTTPSVSTINRQSPILATTNATSVTYRVTFSESVSGVDTSDFTLTTGGASGTIASISGSGTTYDVTVNSISGNGTLRLDLNSGGTGITDTAGNVISGGYTSGQIYTIEIPLTIIFVNPANLSTVNISTGSTVIAKIIDNGTGINPASIQLQIDGGNWVNPTSKISMAEGYTIYYVITSINYTLPSHTLSVRVNDLDGNPAQNTISFTMEAQRKGFGFGKLRFD
jgi:hypothetical protein